MFTYLFTCSPTCSRPSRFSFCVACKKNAPTKLHLCHSFVPAIFLIYPHLSRTPLGRPFLQTRKDQATKGSGRQRTRGNNQRTKRNQCCEKGYCLWTGIQLCPKEMWLLQLYYHSHVETRTQRTQYSVQRLWCQMEARKDHAGCHREPAGTNVRTRVYYDSLCPSVVQFFKVLQGIGGERLQSASREQKICSQS